MKFLKADTIDDPVWHGFKESKTSLLQRRGQGIIDLEEIILRDFGDWL